MKQGRASSSGPGERKMTPVVKKVNVGAVSNIGNMVGTRRAVEPLFNGRGASSPPGKLTTHRSGSQGKH